MSRGECDGPPDTGLADEVLEWTPRPIKGIAFHRDQYATLDNPDVDEFECWIAAEFEEPALEALERATTVGG